MADHPGSAGFGGQVGCASPPRSRQISHTQTLEGSDMLQFLILSAAIAPPVFVFAILAAAWKMRHSQQYQNKFQDSQHSEETTPQNKKYLTVPAVCPFKMEHKLIKKEKSFDHFVSLVFFFRTLFHMTHLPKIVIDGPETFVV